MLATKFARATFKLSAVLTLLVVAASCKDSTSPDEDEEPEVATMRLTIGSTTRDIRGTAGEDRTFRVPLGASTVTAQWLRADGTADPLVVSGVFRLTVTAGTGASAITFVNNSANQFNGTLTVPSAVTGAQLSVGLLHIAENHTDFGPFTITITAP
jgi:hypothetical protein